MRHATTTLALLVALATGAASQSTIHVPADQPTIQAAIDAAAAGDTVLVAPGVYFENLVFPPKVVSVRSSDGPALTTIDGGGLSHVALFEPGANADTELDGFLLTNGHGGGAGGGIYVCGASPTIRRCVIAGNAAGTIGSLFNLGGGVFIDMCAQAFSPARPRFVHCTITENSSDFAGGGVYVADGVDPGMVLPTFESCIIWGNGGDDGIESNAFGTGLAAIVAVTYSDVEGYVGGSFNQDVPPLIVGGGSYSLSAFSPCIDKGNPNAPLDPDGTRADMGAIPFNQPDPPRPWQNLGFELASSFGAPSLTGSGDNVSSSATLLELHAARPLAPAFLIVSAIRIDMGFKQGVMVPKPDIIKNFTVDGFGSASLAFPWPSGVPTGFTAYLQWWVQDNTGPAGFAASNGLAATAQ